MVEARRPDGRGAPAHRTSVVAALPDGTAALVVGQGDGSALVACLPDADHRASGALLGHSDGAPLGFDRASSSASSFAEAAHSGDRGKTAGWTAARSTLVDMPAICQSARHSTPRSTSRLPMRSHR